MKAGFEVIYADSDSIFVKREHAQAQDYENLAVTISKEVGLPIVLDQYYKFLVLLAQEADPSLEATRRYYGKLTTGRLHYKGIELRRHDCPTFVKRFQKKILEILLDAETAENIEKTQFKKACDYVVQTCDRVLAGEIEPEDLVVSKILRKPISEYNSVFPHVAAAI
jgi:DNA polymerase elongation subunit (family B)